MLPRTMQTGYSKILRTSAVDALLERSKLTRIIRDPRHAEWVQAFNGIFEGMKRYVIDFHTTGLAWNVHVSICH